MKPFIFDTTNFAVDFNVEHPVDFVIEADLPEGLVMALIVTDPEKQSPDNIIRFSDDRRWWATVPSITNPTGLRRFMEHEEDEQLTDEFGQPVFDDNDNPVLAEGGEIKYDEDGNPILQDYRMLLDINRLFNIINSGKEVGEKEYKVLNLQLVRYNPELNRYLYTEQGGLLIMLPNGFKPPGIE